MTVRKFAAVDKRVETGVVQFGEDWEAYVLRGDDAFGLANTLDEAAQALRQDAKNHSFLADSLSRTAANLRSVSLRERQKREALADAGEARPPIEGYREFGEWHLPSEGGVAVAEFVAFGKAMCAARPGLMIAPAPEGVLRFMITKEAPNPCCDAGGEE